MSGLRMTFIPISMKRTGLAFLFLSAVCPAQTPPVFTVTTIAGNGTAGYSGDAQQATTSELNNPFAAALAGGKLYIADQLNNRIRLVTPDGTITTVAGSASSGYSGDGGQATAATLNHPTGVSSDSSGNLYIADADNSVIRKVTTGGTITTVAGTINNVAGFSGDGIPGGATNAQLLQPVGVVVDASGNIYIADTGNHRVRKVTPAGTITTVAGNGAPGFTDGVQVAKTELNGPEAVAVDAAGNVYIADTGSNAIRKLSVSGALTTVAGNGSAGFAGDGNAAVRAEINHPKGVAVDAAGNVYIADCFNNRIRMVAANGAITTVAGSGAAGYYGDGGAALDALFRLPTGVAVDAAGNLYVTDNQNQVIRLLTPAAQLPPSINAGGIESASGFGAFPTIAPGDWIEIYGSNLAASSRQWSTSDFSGVNAPTALDRTAVTIGGQAGFIDYISANQVNAQVPSNVGTGPQQITVSTAAGTSAPYTVTVNATQPGLVAKALFNIGGKQYVAAQFTDGVTYVAPPGSIPGVTSRQAKPGETIVIYGVGFGPVSPTIPAGQIVQQTNSLVSQFQIFFAQALAATPSYAGLTPGFVGLYQFNVVVPNIANSDAVPVTFTLGGASGTQTLYTAVHN